MEVNIAEQLSMSRPGSPVSRRGLLVGLLMVPLALGGCKRRRPPEQQVIELFIESDGDFLTFRPDTLACPTAARVRLTFHHTGRFLSAVHNWVLVYPNQMEAVDKDAQKTDGTCVDGRSAGNRGGADVR